MCDNPFGGGDKTAKKEAKRARRAEDERQAKLDKGRASISDQFSQFDNDFFDQRRDAALEFFQPDLENQFQRARDQLTFGLARGGNLQSSAGINELGRLTEERGRNRALIADRARQLANADRFEVERNRTDLLSQLNLTADPAAAAQGALARSDILSKPPSFQPLGEAFKGITANFANFGPGIIEDLRDRRRARGVTNQPNSGNSSRVVL